MPKHRAGDTIVCAFTKGPRGNPISKAPDAATVVIARTRPTPVEEHAPYVCTIRGVSQKEPDKTTYVVHVDHALRATDYDRIHRADFERAKLNLRLRYPTYFKSLRTQDFDATVEERFLPARGSHPERLQLTLRFGDHSSSLELSQEESLRRGLRFNHFVPPPPPPDPAKAVGIDVPRFSNLANWTPTLDDHTGYLLRPTPDLALALEQAQNALGPEALLEHAEHRLIHVLAVAAIEPQPPSTAGDVQLEHALTFLLRQAFAQHNDDRATQRLRLAQRRLLQRRLVHIDDPDLLPLLHITHADWQHETGCFSISLDRFLHQAPELRRGAWHITNLTLRQGRVYLNPDQARRFLAAVAPDPRASPTAPPESPLVQRLAKRISEVLRQLDQHTRQPPRIEPSNLEAIPPCVRHALHEALHRGLSEAECYNAYAFLHHAGHDPKSIQRALHGIANVRDGHYRTSLSSGRLHVQGFQPPPCNINRALGICSWTCPAGVQSPLDFPEAHRA